MGAAGTLEAIACLEATNFTFLFAPAYHPAMKALVPVRKALGVRTVFNILGPLTNPAGAPNQVLGVFSAELLEPLAEVLRLTIEPYSQADRDRLTVAGDDLLLERSPDQRHRGGGSQSMDPGARSARHQHPIPRDR